MDLKKNTKEIVKSRLKQSAAKSWGYQESNAEGFDPVIDLLFGACATEFERLSTELYTSQKRILEKVSQILLPEVFLCPVPSYAIMHGKPSSTEKTTVQTDQFVFEKEFPGKFILYKRFGIDISKEPMLIFPTLHYQNGGLQYESSGETVIPGLFVAGEVGGGVHGENRLMGNSLLDIMVFGRISGKNAGIYAKNDAKDGALSLDHVDNYNKEVADAGIDEDRIAPLLLPDYTLEHVKERQLTARYEGSLR